MCADNYKKELELLKKSAKKTGLKIEVVKNIAYFVNKNNIPVIAIELADLKNPDKMNEYFKLSEHKMGDWIDTCNLLLKFMTTLWNK